MEDKKLIEFTEQEIYDRMLYFAYCFDTDQEDVKSCNSHKQFTNFVKNGSKRHFGDCTNNAMTCSRCFMNRIEILAQNMTDSFMTKKGWCDKDCFTECEGGNRTKE